MEPAKKTDSDLILEQARALVSELESGNADAAEQLIDELGRVREQNLFRELGKMTRQLHDALNSFAVDSRIISMAESEIPDAKARLNHVITMTEDSANRTLAAVETRCRSRPNFRSRQIPCTKSGAVSATRTWTSTSFAT